MVHSSNLEKRAWDFKGPFTEKPEKKKLPLLRKRTLEVKNKRYGIQTRRYGSVKELKEESTSNMKRDVKNEIEKLNKI